MDGFFFKILIHLKGVFQDNRTLRGYTFLKKNWLDESQPSLYVPPGLCTNWVASYVAGNHEKGLYINQVGLLKASKQFISVKYLRRRRLSPTY